MQLISTNTVVNYPHSIIYGGAGSGKTRLIPTLTAPVICNTDAGLVSIRDHNLPFVECTTWKETRLFMDWALKSKEAAQFKEIVLDDFTEACEQYLKQALTQTKDGRQAYGQMADEMLAFVREIRIVSTHTIHLICKEQRIENENKQLLYGPMIPGRAVQQTLGYLVNQIYRMETWTDTAGALGTPMQEYEVLRCKGNQGCEAKDRSGRLGEIEMAHLGNINAKVMS